MEISMIRTVLTAAALALTLNPALANEAQKQAECQFQADLVGAVQQARLDRVRKEAVTETLIAANPGWPDGAAKAIPALAEYVYGFKRRDLRNVDLGAETKQQCLENWDQIQQLKQSVSN
jgi:hypothetical protein